VDELNEDHPLKLVNIQEIIPETFDLQSIINLKHRQLFIMFFVKHLASENSFFSKLDRNILIGSFESFFLFLSKNQEFIECFTIRDDQR